MNLLYNLMILLLSSLFAIKTAQITQENVVDLQVNSANLTPNISGSKDLEPANLPVVSVENSSPEVSNDKNLPAETPNPKVVPEVALQNSYDALKPTEADSSNLNSANNEEEGIESQGCVVISPKQNIDNIAFEISELITHYLSINHSEINKMQPNEFIDFTNKLIKLCENLNSLNIEDHKIEKEFSQVVSGYKLNS